jgi:dihydroorotase
MRAPTLSQAPGPAVSLVLRGARILDPAAGIDHVGDLVVRDGRIGGEPGDAEVVDATGLIVVPGLVDPHVHLRTPGREDTEDIASGTRAAAAGGFVAIAAMPNTRPPVDRASILGSLVEIAEREAVIPVGFIAAITVGQEGLALTEQVELAEAGAVAFSDDGVPVHDAAVMRRALQYQHLTGRPLVLHEEDRDLSAGGVAHEGAAAGRLGLRGIPAVSESVAVARDAALAAFEDGRIHICHVSAAATVEEIRQAKARGVAITAEVTPHHLLLDDRVLDALDPARHKMNPPLRAAEDREALIAALADGTLDCIATDHAPHASNEKDVPFAEAPFGVTGLETAFAACHTALVREGPLDLETLVRRMSTDAARVIDLEPPTLAEGATANLAVIDPDAEWTVGEEPFQSKSVNSAFLGRTLTGRVEMTVAGGRLAWRRGS